MPTRGRSNHTSVTTATSDPISIDRSGLVEVLSDFGCSSAWESLRHFGAPASAPELAQRIGRPPADAQRMLDDLMRVGLVRRLAASARARRIRYEVSTRKIVVSWDPANARHRVLHGRLGHAFERRSASHVAAALPYDQRAANRGYMDRRMFWGHFEQEDLVQVKAIVGMLDLLMARANARHLRAAKSAAPARSARCNYHVSFAIVPIDGEFPPPALIQVEGRQNTPYAKRHRAAIAFETLTPRERQVFDLLLSGSSLADIGRTLGIGRPTVATIARRCYAKFGVGSRQQLLATALGIGRGSASSE